MRTIRTVTGIDYNIFLSDFSRYVKHLSPNPGTYKDITGYSGVTPHT